MTEKDKPVPEFTYGEDSMITKPSVSTEQHPVIDHVPGQTVEQREATTSHTGMTGQMREFGGYTNIRSRVPGTLYQTGMPLPVDVDTNPRPGDPQVPKLRP